MQNTTRFDNVSDTFKQVTNTVAGSTKAGMDIFTQAAGFWAGYADRGVREMRESFEQMAQDTIPMGRRNLERTQRLVDEQARRGMDLLRKAFEAAASPDIAQRYQMAGQLWNESLENARDSFDAAAKMGAQMVEETMTFASTARKNGNGAKATRKNAR